MRFFLYLLLLLILAGLGFTTYSTYAYRTPRAYVPQTVIIPPRTGTREVVGILHQAGLTPSLPVMVMPLVASGQHKALKAGEYAFAAGMSPNQIFTKIARGGIVVHKLTIPEGWNSFMVRAALQREPLLAGALPAEIPEGSVFPDTVHFRRGETRAAVLARMQAAQQAVLMELWAARAPGLPITTPEQALILASIVEKETGIPSERGLIAGVFTNRLRIGMKLQTDPSVVYGIERAAGGVAMGRELSKADLARDTPYNSYTREGLPPTPICNPGRAAIAAVLNPTVTEALYFVATGSGGHAFSASMKEHEVNVANYRRAMHLPAASETAKAAGSPPKRVNHRQKRRK